MGCRHSPRLLAGVSAIGSYSVEEHGGYPFLVPALLGVHTEKDEQSSTLMLEDGPRARLSRERCSIRGEAFSLTPGAQANAWVLRSFTAEAWPRRSELLDIAAQWKLFLQELSEKQRDGCFRVDLFSMERELAAQLPLPATEVLTYLYRDDKSGFVNLAPGMKVVIELPPAERPASQASDGAARVRPVRFDVVERRGGGVELRQRSGEFRHADAAARAIGSGIETSFASIRLVRLFLRSQSEDARRSPMLLGSSAGAALEQETERVQAQGPEACTAAAPDAVCVSFPEQTSVSLLSDVWINGRRMEYPLGTQLGLIVGLLAPGQEEAVFASMRVKRKTSGGAYAPLVFPRTRDGAIQVLLLPGDHVDWRRY